MNNDYKNGYNDCAERMVQVLNQEMIAKRTGYESINDVLLVLRRHILQSAFYKANMELDV